jgi:hypothetical protein
MAACSTGMIEIEGIPKSDSRFAEGSAKGNRNPTRVGRVRRSRWTEGVPKSEEKCRGILREPGPAFRGRAEVREGFDRVSRHLEGVRGGTKVRVQRGSHSADPKLVFPRTIVRGAMRARVGHCEQGVPNSESICRRLAASSGRISRSELARRDARRCGVSNTEQTCRGLAGDPWGYFVSNPYHEGAQARWRREPFAHGQLTEIRGDPGVAVRSPSVTGGTKLRVGLDGRDAQGGTIVRSRGSGCR